MSKPSLSSCLTVPSSVDWLRNSMIERTSRCLLDMVGSKELRSPCRTRLRGPAVLRRGARAQQPQITIRQFCAVAYTGARPLRVVHLDVPFAKMSFFCAISGEAPLDPVISTKSGQIYERRLILKYITENGTDPITGDKLEESDLISVKASAYPEFCAGNTGASSHYRTDPKTAPPRPPNASSIPALLQTLQNEWDATMLEAFALRQQYNSLRQELSYALYAQDAAHRVVARLIRERDAAREYVSFYVLAFASLTPFSKLF